MAVYGPTGPEQVKQMFRQWARDRRGNVAMMFAVAAVPVIAATGAAVDYSMAYQDRTVVQDALDAAALAAARMIGLYTDEEILAAAEAFFRANTEGRIDENDAVLAMTIDGTSVELTTEIDVATNFIGIVGVNNISFDVLSRTVSGGRNVEVALVLDVTGSMSGSKISSLRSAAIDLVNQVVLDEQTPYYTEVALVPYSMGVNLGSYASQVRGSVPSAVSVSGIAWAAAAAVQISSITKANPAVVTTATSHGLATGDIVYITGINDNGSNSFADNLNGNWYTITWVSNTKFRLNGVNSSGWRTFSSSSNDTIRECITANCELVVTETASGTPFLAGEYAYITGLNGTLGSQLNDEAYLVASTTTPTTTFALSGTEGPSYSAYTSGGSAYCTTLGCQYYRFTNDDSPSGTEIWQPSNCVSERTGTNAYTDVAPSTAPVGWNYPSSSNPCLSASITPLTSNRTTLTNQINSFQAAGSTAGQIGIAWGWYLLSPNFSYLWPAANQPASYTLEDVLKVAVLMTDGAFNTPYCSGVISRDAGYGSDEDHINCDATNGDPFAQARALCTAMRNAGITIYTIGFDIGNDEDAQGVMSDCATDSDHAFLAATGAQLQEVFRAIGTDISELRIAE